MPKIKTLKPTAKRIKIAEREKLRRLKQVRSHLRRKEPKPALGSMDKHLPVTEADEKRARPPLALGQRKP